MGAVTLITGGVRSGKSNLALKIGEKSNYTQKIFIATAEVIDEEMHERVEKHRLERGDVWKTVEEQIDLVSVIKKTGEKAVVVIDCCTVWLGNIWHVYGSDNSNLETNIENLCSFLKEYVSQRQVEIIIVSNEVGWGIVPHDPAVRRYRDWAGKLNQRIAGIATEVYLCVSGIPVKIKGEQ
ncbi:MAG: bifunctional adenosylcobinamide kinase/adenosylcobinamide-phosphate guanylyltransferase [Fibrobacter sp.]|nr:bifunctional adenosylcobinamide kinase/adenosylcobinamide-phosphate guanylyltransferase [Fibrobacter sp.]